MNLLIIHRRGLWLVFDPITQDFEVFTDRKAAERYIVEQTTLIELNTLLVQNLN